MYDAADMMLWIPLHLLHYYLQVLEQHDRNTQSSGKVLLVPGILRVTDHP